MNYVHSHEILHYLSLLGILIFVVSNMFAMGSRYTIEQILAPLQSMRLLLSTLVANFVILPLGCLALAVGFRLEEAMSEGLILLGLASGAPFVPKLTELAGGNLPFAVAAMGLLTVGTIVYMPLTVPLLVPGVTVSPLTVARPLLLFVLLPLASGLVARAYLEDVAIRFGRVFNRLSNASLVPTVILIVAVNVNSAVHVFGTSGILAGLLLVFLGLVVGWLFGGPARDIRRALALSTGVRNFAVAIVVAGQGFEDPRVETMVTVAGIVALLVVTPLSLLWARFPLPR